MKILGVTGSLRKGGNTEFTVKSSLKAATALGAKTDEINLSDYNIHPCSGCGICKKEKCHIDDGMHELLLKVAEADALIIGGPVYYGSISGGLKSFLDRCRPLKLQGNQLRGKFGGAIAVGKIWGHSNAIDTIFHFFGSQGIFSVPIYTNPGIGVQVFASELGDAEKDIEGQKPAEELGKRIVECLVRAKEK